MLILPILSSCSFRHLEAEKTSMQELQNALATAKIAEANAKAEREKSEDLIAQSLYEECYQSALAGSGRFEVKQKKAFECFKKTNSWTVATANSVAPERLSIIHKIQKNEYSKIWSWIPSEASPVNRSQSVGTPKAPSKPMATALWHWSTISQSSVKNDAWGKSEKGKSKKYWQAYDVAITQIHKWEGLHTVAYWDHKGYTIGYGTRSYQGEVITPAEADRRLVGVIKPVLDEVIQSYTNESSESQWALVSFAFNCWRGWRDVKNNGLQQHQYWCKTASGKRLAGLVARRNEEHFLIFNK